MNPKNPYPREISFDQHVWLPAPGENYRTIVDLIEDRHVLDRLIRNYLNVVDGPAPALLASNRILSRLSEDELAQVARNLEERGVPQNPRDLIVSASYFFPGMRGKLGTSINNPPDNIHRMQKEEMYVGDMYGADMVETVLDRCGLSFGAGENYLDFGCSSGSLIRILKAAEPDCLFHGVDPISSSIEWADKNIDGATFAVSNVNPPLHYSDGTFGGVTAISIWSHLGEQEALAWFDEMYRVLKTDGWLLFTTHGETSIGFFNRVEAYIPRRILALLEGLVNSDFVFEEVYLGESPEGLSATGYGNAYFRRSWADRHLSGKWDIVYFGEGENQHNQDIYILRKRSEPRPGASLERVAARSVAKSARSGFKGGLIRRIRQKLGF